ncbi:hypothetical protein H4S02_003989 [Coemansia sp. RSA 2611]|nr:hypothetical protein H4S02_003989 [Coemansia sp. RSA 2611]KAJ2696264.1 hypothetical protein H4218_004703 [Coemansia sp. IMI 209128]
MPRESAEKRVRFAEGSRRSSVPEFSIGAGPHSSGDEYDSDINAELEADITSSRRQRRRVNIDGYGSDASDQDEVRDLSDVSDDQESEPDEEAKDDMFADDAGSSEQHEEKKRKRFLDLDDIEGQEMSSASRTEGNDSFKSKEPEREASGSDDESGRGRIRIEAFNMKDDFEEGKFDASGNFVWNKQDPQAYQDDWLHDVSQSAITQARESKAKRDSESLHTLGDGRWESNDDIIMEILDVLRPRETVLTALARIGGPKQKSKNKWANKKANQKGPDADDSGKDAERKRAIEHLAVLADQAMARGMADIYEDTYEQFVRQMRIAGRIPDDWIVGTPIQSSSAIAVGASPPSGTSANVDAEILGDLDEPDPSHQ